MRAITTIATVVGFITMILGSLAAGGMLWWWLLTRALHQLGLWPTFYAALRIMWRQRHPDRGAK